MDRRDAAAGTSVAAEDKKYTRAELDAMPLEKVIEIYEQLAKDMSNRTEAIKRLLPKRGATRVDQREGANEAKRRLMVGAMTDFEIMKAYVTGRMFNPLMDDKP